MIEKENRSSAKLHTTEQNIFGPSVIKNLRRQRDAIPR